MGWQDIYKKKMQAAGLENDIRSTDDVQVFYRKEPEQYGDWRDSFMKKMEDSGLSGDIRLGQTQTAARQTVTAPATTTTAAKKRERQVVSPYGTFLGGFSFAGDRQKSEKELADEKAQQEAYLQEYRRLAGLDLDDYRAEVEQAGKKAQESKEPYNIHAFGAYNPQKSEAERTYAAMKADLNKAESIQYDSKGREALDKLTEEQTAALEVLASTEGVPAAAAQADYDRKVAARETLLASGLSEDELSQLVNYQRNIPKREKNAERYAEVQEMARNEGEKSPIGGTLLSVPANLLSGIGTVYTAVEKLRNPDTPADYHSPAMLPYAYASGVRGEVTKNLQYDHGDAAAFAYGVGTSMLDSAATVALAALGVPPAAASATLGGAAATDAMVAAKDRGLDDDHAIATGVAAGILESFFEKVSLESLIHMKLPTGTAKQKLAGMLKNAAIQGGIEGSEEMFTDLANLWWDKVINGDMADVEQRINAYMAGGMSHQEAQQKVVGETIKDIAVDFGAGALAGGLMGGGNMAVQTAAQHSNELTAERYRQFLQDAGVQLDEQQSAEDTALTEASDKYGAQAEVFRSTYTEGQDVALYDSAYRIAYEYGKAGAKEEAVMQQEELSYLSETQRKIAYIAGREAAAREKAAPVKSGKVVYEQGVDRKSFTDIQRTSVKLAEAITQAVNGEVHLYSTTQDAEGKRTIDQKDVAALLGSAENAPNGFYDHKTGNIYVDINAGNNGEGTILYTLGHEYTHLIHQNARESFDKLAEYLFSRYGEQGVDVDALVLAKREVLGVDYETAYEEVVADSMEAMLTDTNAAEKIAALKKTDKALWEKLKDLVGKLLESVRGLYQNMTPNSEEGRKVQQMADALDKLSDLFVEGLGNVQTVVETGEGRVLYQARSSKDSEVVSIKQQIASAKTQLDSMEPVANKSILQNLQQMNIKQKRAWAEAEIKKAGFSIDRQGYGRILIEPDDINSALNYIKDNGGISAFPAVPAVLRRGVEVFRDKNHKGRSYDTVTFAAPVVINGVRGNMAVVVRETGKNRYDMHRIVLPDGSAFEFVQKANAVSTAVGGVTEGAKSSGVVTPTINTASNERPSTRRTLHADVNQTAKGSEANAQPSETIIPTSDEKSNTKISKQVRDYSYAALTAKPDMQVTTVDDTENYAASSEARKNIIARAIAAAKKVGSTNENGNAVIHVDDTDTDVILSTKGLRHGLDRRFSTNAPVTLRAGEILKNAVRINELTPKKDTVDASYVLIGAAKNAKNEPYIVQFVVNRASNEVTSVDVLYSIGTKKEPAALLPEVTGVPATLTGSTISISSLLDYVNKYFPDILPESVLKHYGYTARPDGELGESALFQKRGTSDREILTTTAEDSVKNERERELLAEYKDKVGRLEGYEARLSANRAELTGLSLADGKKNTKRIALLRDEIIKDTNRVEIVQTQLQQLEGSRGLQNLLGREKDAIRMQQAARMQELEEKLAEYREKYGVFPGGEKAARDIQLPKKSSENEKISQTVRTVLEAKATPEEMVPDIEDLALEGKYSYETYSDKAAIADADGEIKRVGWAQALTDWKAAMKAGNVSKKNTAMGWALYNNAANSGDTETALDVLSDMVQHQRSAAQALQATRILKQLSPETQLYQAQRSIANLQTQLNEEYGDDKAPKLKIDQTLAEQFMKAADQAERDAVLANIYRDIGKQMPSRFKDKWNAWRYLAMLGNVRTHVRNVVGNAGFVPVVAAKNVVATGIEKAVYRLSGGKMQRSKEFVTGKGGKALLEAAAQDYAKVADVAMGGGKYSDFANANKYIEEGRVIFRTKPLEAARKANSRALDKEDAWFSKPHYAYAMAQYCKANGITAEMIAKGGDKVVKAREYAIKEAQKATYRDTNVFSQAISELGRMGRNSKNGAKRTISTVMEGILPFRKTPANILARGVEYSPIGLLNGFKQAIFDVQKGTKTAAEAIDAISAGLTGTGLLALGLFWAAQGLVRGHGDDDDKKNDFMELAGHQAYALELPNGTSVTLDWLAPECLPFFVGVNLWELTDGGDKPATMADWLTAISQVSEPMLEMSCLQSLNDVFDSVGYAKNNGLPGLPTALANAATSYVAQGIPTILGQAERTGEGLRYTTFTSKNSKLTGDMQYALGRASAKVPGWDYSQIPFIDAWGRTESTGEVGTRAFNNFLNPAYTSTVDMSAMEEELLRLYEVTGENVFPSRAKKYFNADNQEINLTGEQYVTYAQKKGGEAYKWLTELTQSAAYRNMSNEEKVECIDYIYKAANEVAKAEVVSSYEPTKWVKEALKGGGVVKAAITKTMEK